LIGKDMLQRGVRDMAKDLVWAGNIDEKKAGDPKFSPKFRMT